MEGPVKRRKNRWRSKRRKRGGEDLEGMERCCGGLGSGKAMSWEGIGIEECRKAGI